MGVNRRTRVAMALIACASALLAGLPGPAVPAPGVTGSTVRIGVIVPDAPGAGLAGEAPLLGLQDAPAILARHLNETGGIAGRTVEVDEFRWRYDTELDDPEGQYFGACQRFSGSVFAVVSLAPSTRAFADCLAANGTMLIPNALHAFGSSSYLRERDGLLVAPSDMTVDRWVPAFAHGLVHAGLVKRTDRVGVLRYAGPMWSRASRNLAAGLNRSGVTPMAEAVVLEGRDAVTRLDNQRRFMDPSTRSGIIDFFQRTGIDTLLMLVDGPTVRQFVAEAGAIGYRPRYALNTMSEPAELGGAALAPLLEGSMGIGWRPDTDVPGAVRPPVGRHGRACLDVLSEVVLADDAARDLAFGLCEGMFLLREGGARAPALTSSGFAAGVESLGASLPAIRSLRSRFTPDRHDAAVRVRPFVFDDGCACFSYAGAGMSVR